MNKEKGGFAVLNGKTGGEVRLAMQGLWLTGRVSPVGARLLIAHTFRSAEDEPLEVIYAFALPRDGALRRFRIVGEGFQVRSDLRPVREAQEAYEKGVSAGHLSTLARTYRDGRVNLSVSNIRPGELVKVFLELLAGVDLRDDGFRFRFPFALAPCYHRNARAAEIEPGVGELELPEEEFGDVLLPHYLTDSARLHQIGFELALHMGNEIAVVASPSHSLRVTGLGTTGARAALGREGDVPNRDLVLDVQSRESSSQCYGGLCRAGKARFTAIVPSHRFGRPLQARKSVVFVLDRSGSMMGKPLAQAKRAVEACLGVLSEKDQFGLVAFDDHSELFRRRLAEGTSANREALGHFMSRIASRGGTELGDAIRAALKLAGKARADLLVITDGQVAATESILDEVRNGQIRLHCLGIGAASQDRFLTLLTRESGGMSRFVTPGERVDIAALDLFAAIGAPVASDVRIEFEELSGGRTVLPLPADVYDGHPLVVMGEADSGAKGELLVRWGTGGAEEQFRLDTNLVVNREAEIVRLLQGARLITDLEAQVFGELRGQAKLDGFEDENEPTVAKLEALGREYGLASRAMALVAIVERPGDDGSQVPLTRVVPVGMPEDTDFTSYFPRPAPASLRFLGRVRGAASALTEQRVGYCAPAFLIKDAEPESEQESTPEGVFVKLSGQLLPDGGLPGKTDEERIRRSLVLLVAFLAFGHTIHIGAFRLHVRKVVAFLRLTLPHVTGDQRRKLIDRLLTTAETGKSFTIRDREQALALLASPEATGGKVWEAFEQEISNLV